MPVILMPFLMIQKSSALLQRLTVSGRYTASGLRPLPMLPGYLARCGVTIDASILVDYAPPNELCSSVSHVGVLTDRACLATDLCMLVESNHLVTAESGTLAATLYAPSRAQKKPEWWERSASSRV